MSGKIERTEIPTILMRPEQIHFFMQTFPEMATLDK
jgi:hypothetical protein